MNKCKGCPFLGSLFFENTTLKTCNVLIYLIKQNHNVYYTDALVSDDDDCKVYKCFLKWFLDNDSLNLIKEK